MVSDGDQALMAEYILEEKRLSAALDALDERLEAPLGKLERARSLLLKAKGAYDQAKSAVDALESDRVLLEGEIAQLVEKKSKLRVEARVAEGGGVRPGTAAFVEQLDELAGDKAEFQLNKRTKALDVEAELERLKDAMK
jgi:hypothetical protein